MDSYNIKFIYSLDIAEQLYRNQIESLIPEYVKYWETFVGLHSIEKGVIRGYKLTFDGKQLNPLQIRLKSNFEKIRNTSYGILIQWVMINRIDNTKIKTENYIESIEIVQEITNTIGILYFYMKKLRQYLNEILESDEKPIIEYEHFLETSDAGFKRKLDQFRWWRNKNVHEFILPRALSESDGIVLPSGKKPTINAKKFIPLYPLFIEFRQELPNFINFLFKYLYNFLDSYVFKTRGDLDRPMTIYFDSARGYETVVVDPVKEGGQPSFNVIGLEKMFKDGYDKVKQNLGPMRYVHGSGSINLDARREETIYFDN